MNTKILTILAIIFLLVTPMIQARTLVWTDISDSTSVDFSITESNDDDDDNNNYDEDYEEECYISHEIIESENPQTTYSEWNCINNRLQRTITTDSSTRTEYGGICGLELTATKKPTNTFTLIPFILAILIILILIAIIAILLIRR